MINDVTVEFISVSSTICWSKNVIKIGKKKKVYKEKAKII